MRPGMIRLTVICAGLATPLSAPHAADGKQLTVGYITTLTGGAAILGKAQMNGLMLGLAEHGWKKDGDALAGVPMKLVVADDQAKPDVGLRIARKMLQSDGAQIVAGIIWSNVLMAIQSQVFRAGRIILTTNAGPSPMAGRRCNRLFVSTAFQNDENGEAMGLLMNRDRIDNVLLMAPNYQAGKDQLAGIQRTFKGKVAGEILFPVGQTDHQAEISRIRAVGPKAVFIFAPGGMGISFVKQWAASGIAREVRLYTVYSIDNLTLKAIGKSAVGTYHTNYWNPDSPNPRNKAFIKKYVAKYKSTPSMFSVSAYDAVTLLADGLKAVKGNIDDLPALAAAMRKGGLRSVRGDLKYNVNGFLIQPYYRREVVLNAQGIPVIKGGEQVMFRKDSYWKDCPASQRIE